MSCSSTEIDTDTNTDTEIDDTEIDTDTEDGKMKCKLCDMILTYGFDENDMLHCQNCHNIWDGNAQCTCFL